MSKSSQAASRGASPRSPQGDGVSAATAHVVDYGASAIFMAFPEDQLFSGDLDYHCRNITRAAHGVAQLIGAVIDAGDDQEERQIFIPAAMHGLQVLLGVAVSLAEQVEASESGRLRGVKS